MLINSTKYNSFRNYYKLALSLTLRRSRLNATLLINSLLLYTVDVLVIEGYNLLKYYLLYNT